MPLPAVRRRDCDDDGEAHALRKAPRSCRRAAISSRLEPGAGREAGGDAMRSTVVDAAVALAARAACTLASRIDGPRLSILIFHRVVAAVDPLFPGELDGARFERLMKLVARAFNVLSLPEAARRLAAAELSPRALAITFDDGYADNFDIALPILARLGLPATVFVSTGFLDGGRMWNDTVIECLRRTPRETLDLGDHGLPNVPIGTGPERRAVIDRLLSRIKYLSLREREDAIRKLHTACGEPALPSTLMMSSEQVRGLRAAGMVIGAHTVNHPILCRLDDDEAEREIADSRKQLETLIDDPVALFAYPNGHPGQDYDTRHVSMVRRLGFTAAVSTAVGVSRPGDDLFQLPRSTPWDVSDFRWLARLAVAPARRAFAKA